MNILKEISVVCLSVVLGLVCTLLGVRIIFFLADNFLNLLMIISLLLVVFPLSGNIYIHLVDRLDKNVDDMGDKDHEALDETIPNDTQDHLCEASTDPGTDKSEKKRMGVIEYVNRLD